MFNAKKMTKLCVLWIQNWFEQNGKGCNAVIGISGGKDSFITAALCVEALGKERVIGVLMPNGIQGDIQESMEICKYLEIEHTMINIEKAYTDIIDRMKQKIKWKDSTSNNIYLDLTRDISPTEQTKINLAPRLRMTVLYAISQSLHGRVANTCNLSETYVGYETRYGDAAGDFAPIAEFTVGEVIQIGNFLELPSKLVNKTPSDGLCGLSDEDNLGFTYEVLDKYIRTGICEDIKIKRKIDDLHKSNLFKSQLMQSFPAGNFGGANE